MYDVIYDVDIIKLNYGWWYIYWAQILFLKKKDDACYEFISF
jgi:hypothetical protein